MIQQRIGDLLEIEEGGKYFYVVVLTKVVMFGGNILFAFHNDGKKRELASLAPDSSGFNICADLLLPKREGRVARLSRYEDLTGFWRTKFAKATNEYRPGVKAKEWSIYKIDDLTRHIARVPTLTPEYRRAMDSGCHSFDLVAGKVLARELKVTRTFSSFCGYFWGKWVWSSSERSYAQSQSATPGGSAAG